LLRLPDAVASLPLAQALSNLFASVWEGRYESVYSRAEALFNLARQADFSHIEVAAAVLTTLVSTFIESFRQRTIVLLSKAYTTIPLALAEVYLGLPAGELLSTVLEKGWNLDATSHILTPVAVARKHSQCSTPSTLRMFNAVADNVARLEA